MAGTSGASIYAGVQISNKEVAVKPKFTIRDVKSEVSFSLCKYEPWYNNINNRFECMYRFRAVWRFVVLLLSSFCGVSIFAAGFSSAFGNFAHYCVVLLNAPLGDRNNNNNNKSTCLQWFFPGTLDPSSLTPVSPVVLLVCSFRRRDNRDFKIRDATASRARWLLKDWEQNAVVWAGKVKLRSPSRCKTTRLRIALYQCDSSAILSQK